MLDRRQEPVRHRGRGRLVRDDRRRPARDRPDRSLSCPGQGEAGAAVALPQAGRRALAVEVQALVAPTDAPARRQVTGLDPRRFQLVAAVLDRAGGPGRAVGPVRRVVGRCPGRRSRRVTSRSRRRSPRRPPGRPRAAGVRLRGRGHAHGARRGPARRSGPAACGGVAPAGITTVFAPAGTRRRRRADRPGSPRERRPDLGRWSRRRAARRLRPGRPVRGAVQRRRKRAEIGL